jgi:molybdopterin/thiamine biosynthesis adenylyltransferase
MIDPLRHLEVFSPEKFGQRQIDIIGVGATGSRIGTELIRLGVQHLHVWDDDVIEEHNIGNQDYEESDLEKQKVDAFAARSKRVSGTDVITHNEKYVGQTPLGEIVFLLVDSMKARKEIFEKGIKLKPSVRFVIETRMGVDQGRIYAFDPSSTSHVNKWEKTLYTDEEAPVSACGATSTIGATAGLIAGLATWQFIKYANGEPYENIIQFGTRPFLLSANFWK